MAPKVPAHTEDSHARRARVPSTAQTMATAARELRQSAPPGTAKPKAAKKAKAPKRAPRQQSPLARQYNQNVTNPANQASRGAIL